MRTLSVLFILAFLSSCKHESDNTDNTVIIGDSNRNYTIIKPDPPILVTKSHPDSLDLNSDGIFEIMFIISPIQTVTGIGSKTEITIKNKLQILLSEMNLPDTLSIKFVLSRDSIWSDLDSELPGIDPFTILLQSYACYSYLHCVGWGNFRNTSGKYLGYRIEEKFGWILVDSSTDLLKIKEYTVVK